MMTINMQYFGNKGAASGKSGGAAGGSKAVNEARASDTIEAQKKQIQQEYDKASESEKIQMLESRQEADPFNEVNESLWNHAIAEATPVEITSESSKGMYIRENREYVGSNLLAAQTDAVRSNTGVSSFLYRGSKGNLYIYTGDIRGHKYGKDTVWTLRQIKK